MSNLPKLKEKLQEVFNEFIRLRDLNGCAHFKCISCGQVKDKGQMNAGHFYSVGQYDGLRYDEDNVHGQCIQCNKYQYGNPIEYARNLPGRIGEKRFEALQIRAGFYRRNGNKWHRFEIELLIIEYKKKVQELKY